MNNETQIPSFLLGGTAVKTDYDAENRSVCFRVFGEMDHHGVRRAREEMDAFIGKHHPIEVRMDLAGVTFMDSAGLGLMLGRYTKVGEYGGRLILVNPSAGIMKILSLSGADRLFAIEQTKKIMQEI